MIKQYTAGVGAKIENILWFDGHYPKVKKLELKYNFRSTHAIVEIANKAIRKIPTGRRISKAMKAVHFDEASDHHIETMGELTDVQLRTFVDEKDEASWVATRIKQLLGCIITEKDGSERAIHFGDMAILLRSVRSSGQIFADILRESNIPVVVKGIGGLFDHVEIRVIQAAFCLLARTDFILEDNLKLIRLTEPEIREYIRDNIRWLRDNDFMPNADEAVFLEWVASKREELDKRNLEKTQRGRLARRIYPQSIFQEMLKTLGAASGQEPWKQDILFNFGRLSGLITQFEAVHQWVTPNDLISLCMFLGGWAVGRVDEGGLDELVTPNAVQIMTVHGAKGLEWPVVFIPRVSSQNFPSSYRNRGPESFLDESLFNSRNYAGGDDGERRLWYVALTRCRKFLNITSLDRSRKRPTEYFTEIHHDCVQRNGQIIERRKGQPTPPSNVDLLPTTYSDLNYFWRCPFEYQLRSMMGFGPGVKESYGYGQQIHNILAELHQKALTGEYLSENSLMKLVDERFHLRYTRDSEYRKPLTILREAAKATLKRYLKEYSDTAQYVLDTEKSFEFVEEESGALISGSIDLLEHVERTPNGEKRIPVGIVDFKTHHWKDKETYNIKKAEVETQLRLYAIGVHHALGHNPLRAVAHFLSPKPPDNHLLNLGVEEKVVVDISPKELEYVRQKVKEAVKDIRSSINSGKFVLKGCDGLHCKRCDFRVICPGYTRWLKIDKTTPRPPSYEESYDEEMVLIMEEMDAG